MTPGNSRGKSFERLEPRYLLTRLIDLDGDQDLDVLVEPDNSLRPSEVGWFENIAGRYSEYRPIASIARMKTTVVDIDGDDDLDIVRNGNQWHEHVDSGFLAGRPLFPTTGVIDEIRTLDVGRDGDSDLVVISQQQLHIYENVDGVGTFELQQSIDVASMVGEREIHMINVGDFNNDGYVDPFVVTIFQSGRSPTHQTSWFGNLQDGTFQESTLDIAPFDPTFGRYPQVSILVDVDGDGNLDVIQDSSNPSVGIGDVTWFGNDGDGGFSDRRPIVRYFNDTTQNVINETPARFVDVDADGDIDLLMNSFSTTPDGLVSHDYWLRNESGFFLSCDCEIRNQHAIDAGDINGDEIPDFLLLGTDSENRPIWNDGSALSDSARVAATQHAIHRGYYARNLDLDSNGLVNLDDMQLLLSSIESVWGDVNFDGIFDSSDLVRVFQAGEYEDEIHGNSTWEEGDWNGDGDFGSADLTLVFEAGGFSQTRQVVLSGEGGEIESISSVTPLLAGNARNLIDGNKTAIATGVVRLPWDTPASFLITLNGQYSIREFHVWNGRSSGQRSFGTFSLIFRDADERVIDRFDGDARELEVSRDAQVFDVGTQDNVSSIELIIETAGFADPYELRELEFLGISSDAKLSPPI